MSENIGQVSHFLLGVAIYVQVLRSVTAKDTTVPKSISPRSAFQKKTDLTIETALMPISEQSVDIYRVPTIEDGLSSPIRRKGAKSRQRSGSTCSSADTSQTADLKIPDLNLGPNVPVAPSTVVAPIVERIDKSTNHGELLVVGIAGGSGSGKTTLARAIYDSLGFDNITYIAHDSYYKDISHLPLKEREQQNFDHPDSLETSLLVEHVQALKNGKKVKIPTYDYSTHSRNSETEEVESRPILLIEGILILSDAALVDIMDIKIFVDTDDDIRLIRRLQRDTIERGR